MHFTVPYNHTTIQLQHTDNPRNICEGSLQMYFKVVAKNFYAFNTTSSQMSENERLSFEWYALVRSLTGEETCSWCLQ